MSNSDFKTCPGIKNFVRPIPEYFPCPSCGGNVEIWSDENMGICDGCEKEIGRPQKEQSCLDWCEHADKCRDLIKHQKVN
ncbi:MAG: hypothetical protein JSW72_03920 [Candidatus Bathyarchaeota archaeon]|nr:MAG: hypothetical protein JSW72_03920 [Candidatus Bathyarchaeota archaeon]